MNEILLFILIVVFLSDPFRLICLLILLLNFKDSEPANVSSSVNLVQVREKNIWKYLIVSVFCHAISQVEVALEVITESQVFLLVGFETEAAQLLWIVNRAWVLNGFAIVTPVIFFLYLLVVPSLLMLKSNVGFECLKPSG